MNVLILGQAKSGTTLLTYMVKESLPKCGVIFEPKTQVTTNEKNNVCKILFPNDISEQNYTQIYNLLSLYGSYEKRILIVRDPRDIIISSYFYAFYKGHNVPEHKFKNAMQKVTEKENIPGKYAMIDLFRDLWPVYINNLKTRYDILLKFIKGLSQKYWYIAKYEDVIQNNVQGLNQYLGFELKPASVPKSLNRVVRTKDKNNWKDYFTQRDVQAFKPIFKAYMDLLGYDNDWQLNKPQTLNPQFGSKYMNRVWVGEK